jgi:RNA polymerase-binding transcription factor DksA
MGYTKKRDTERSSDLLDQASQASELFLEESITQATKHVQPERHPDFDGKHCVDESCGVVIPKARLAMGRVRCVDCQALQERNAKQYVK